MFRSIVLFCLFTIPVILSQRTETVQYGTQIIDIHLAGQPLLHSPSRYKPGSDSGRTELINGHDIRLPAKRYLPITYPPTFNDGELEKDDYGREMRRLGRRALVAGPLFGTTGMPYWTDARQNVNSCGLTSAIQSIARLIPELLASNSFVEENSTSVPSSVLVGVANWDVLPLVKLGVPVEKNSINATNMMSGDIWWPGAFEKAIELLGQNTTFILSSRAMTMISGLSAGFNLITNSGLSMDQGASDKEMTWKILLRSMETPITIQTFHNVTGILQLNHIFTVLSAEEVGGVRALTLHNPLGYDNVITYDTAWPQLYLCDYLTSFPTRKDSGLGLLVESTPYTLIPPPEGDGVGSIVPTTLSKPIPLPTRTDLVQPVTTNVMQPVKPTDGVVQKGPAAPGEPLLEAGIKEGPAPEVESPSSPISTPLDPTATLTTPPKASETKVETKDSMLDKEGKKGSDEEVGGRKEKQKDDDTDHHGPHGPPSWLRWAWSQR